MKQLIRALEDMGLTYNESMIRKFQRYMELILEWNEKINLTAIKDQNEFIIKHYIDSIAICGFPQVKEAARVIDVGTGAGFPGIPLAILYPDKKFLLMDSLNKRIRIIEGISREIGLENVTFRHGRAEDLAQEKDCREQFDLCVSRAVAKLTVLSEYCLPFVKVGGWFGAYKTGSAEEEIKGSRHAAGLLGGELTDGEQVKIEGFDLDHTIAWIKKVRKTPAKYPRKAGTPEKEPLK